MSANNTVWILTCEHNEYNQFGEYFIAAFGAKPDRDALLSLKLEFPVDLDHLLRGGGRVHIENEWYYLREYTLLGA